MSVCEDGGGGYEVALRTRGAAIRPPAGPLLSISNDSEEAEGCPG